MSVKHLYSLLSVFAIVAVMTSCGTDPKTPGRTFIPDMAYSQAYEYYTVNATLSDSLGIDSMTARKPVVGTIKRGTLPTAATDSSEDNQSFTYGSHYAATDADYERAGLALTNPVEFTPANVAEGKKQYTIYCQPCHGADGGGQGPVVKNGGYPPVPYTYAEQFASITAGNAFHSITYGKGNMGSYASQLTVEERWKVIYYVQKLAKAGPFAEITTASAETEENE